MENLLVSLADSQPGSHLANPQIRQASHHHSLQEGHLGNQLQNHQKRPLRL